MQVVLAVDYMHRLQKVNRDIRLENCLVTTRPGGLPCIKISGFGLSKDRLNNSAPHTQAGCALYTAPEVMLNLQGRCYEGEAVDVWSCGVVSRKAAGEESPGGTVGPPPPPIHPSLPHTHAHH